MRKNIYLAGHLNKDMVKKKEINHTEISKLEMVYVTSDGGVFGTLPALAGALGVTLSAAWKVVNEGRTTRGGVKACLKPRVLLVKLADGGRFALRTAARLGDDWESYLDISADYYRGGFVRR